MFLEKYIDSTYVEMIYDNYENSYINSLDERNFLLVYNLLKGKGFYFIDDIALNYLELFELKRDNVEKALNTLKEIIGKNYIKEIGHNMILVNKIIELASKFDS